MEPEYKVRWAGLDGFTHVSEWCDIIAARQQFNKLKNERIIRTVWAELCYASIEDNGPDEVIVIESFEREVIELFGKKVVC